MSLSVAEGQLLLGLFKMFFNRKKKKKQEEPEETELMDLVESLVEKRLEEKLLEEKKEEANVDPLTESLNFNVDLENLENLSVKPKKKGEVNKMPLQGVLSGPASYYGTGIPTILRDHEKEASEIRSITWTHRYIKSKWGGQTSFVQKLLDTPINIELVAYNSKTLVWSPKKKGSFHTYMVKDGVAAYQEHASHEVNNRFIKMLYKKKPDYIICIQNGRNNKIVGRSKLTEV